MIKKERGLLYTGRWTSFTIFEGDTNIKLYPSGLHTIPNVCIAVLHI